MSQVHFQNAPVQLQGHLPAKGARVSHLAYTHLNLHDATLEEYQGKKIILWFVPSLDTGVCLTSAKKLNEHLKKHPDAHALILSMDLPFAQKRICGLEHLDHVTTVSCFRHPETLEKMGIKIAEGALKGLAARAVFVLDSHGNLTYSELVSEITQEPNYTALFHHLSHPHG